MKLNNKGFSLIEVLAVIVILGVLATIMIPAANQMLNENKENSLKNLEKSIKSATKVYMSDNRYDIDLDGNCDDPNNTRNITKIKEETITESKISLARLINAKVLTTNADGKIINPKTNNEINKNTSYITVRFSCTKKDFEYGTDYTGGVIRLNE